MNMDRLKDSVKQHEGYRNKVYLDTLGKRTVGVGHLCVEDFWEDDKEYEEKFLMEILADDLQNAIKGARELKELVNPMLEKFKYLQFWNKEQKQLVKLNKQQQLNEAKKQ